MLGGAMLNYMMTSQHVQELVVKVSGGASASGGLVTTGLAFLNKNAAAFGVIFTAATFTVYAVGTAYKIWREERDRKK